METFSQLVSVLQEAGIGASPVLIFEATGDDFGSGQAEDYRKLISGLQTLVGEKGTLVVPTCTAVEGYPKPTYDPSLSPSEMGPFSEFFRLEPQVVRSHSNTHSIAALGKDAEELIQGHRYAAGRPTPWGEGPFGVGSPWDWLYNHHASWVLVDPQWSRSPSINYIQALYAFKHKGITKTAIFPVFSDAALVQELERRSVIKRISWENHAVYLFEMQSMVSAALEVLETAPQSLSPDAGFSTWLKTLEKIRQEGYTMAGVAKARITPPVPCLRWDGKKMTGIYRDLFARVVALSHGEHRIALVLCDLEAISGQIVNRIRKQVQAQIGLSPELIMIAATHAHSTPDTTGAGFEDPDYIQELVTAVASGICQAFSELEPARLGWGVCQSVVWRIPGGCGLLTGRYIRRAMVCRPPGG